MPAYIIARIDISKPEQYREYTRRSPKVVAQFGGRFIVRGAEIHTLEGPAETRRIVVLEFPSIEKARAFWESPEYRRLRKFREGAGDAQFMLLDGYPTSEWERVLEESRKVD